MRVTKIKDSYNDYKVEMSFGQLQAIKNALANDHSDPLSDELYAELEWYLQNVPGPGESEDDLKAAEEAGKTGLDQAPPGDQPVGPGASAADQLLPAPEDEMGSEGEGELPPEGEGEGEPLPPDDGLGEEPPPAPEEEEEPVEAARGADDRIPAPPED